MYLRRFFIFAGNLLVASLFHLTDGCKWQLCGLVGSLTTMCSHLSHLKALPVAFLLDFTQLSSVSRSSSSSCVSYGVSEMYGFWSSKEVFTMNWMRSPRTGLLMEFIVNGTGAFAIGSCPFRWVRNIILDRNEWRASHCWGNWKTTVKTLICSYWRLLSKVLNVIWCLGPCFSKYNRSTLQITQYKLLPWWRPR